MGLVACRRTQFAAADASSRLRWGSPSAPPAAAAHMIVFLASFHSTRRAEIRQQTGKQYY